MLGELEFSAKNQPIQQKTGKRFINQALYIKSLKCSVSTCMNKTIATEQVVDNRMSVRSIDGHRFLAVFSITSGSLAISELSGRSALILAMMAGPFDPSCVISWA